MVTETTTGYTQIELLTLSGPEYRRVSTNPPRPPTEDEIPIIDLTPIDGDLESRKELAMKIRKAAQNTGFFYIKNHGISDNLIERALSQAKAFFAQSDAEKDKVSFRKSQMSEGYHRVGSTQINHKESRDNKETFSIRYNPEYDPTVANPDHLLANKAYSYGGDDFLWDGTSHLPKFRETTIEFWERRLTLARKMVSIFALALNLPEDYFNKMITHPGADGLYIHYPGTGDTETNVELTKQVDAGIGSHTDIQCLTLLWQDMSGGLQVLSASDEWLDAQPIPGTLVVNIGDFLQRLSNNTFKSTVHRVHNRQATSRYSMPFFLGFNPDAICEVVPSCIDEEHPALYDPISCGEWHRSRLALAQRQIIVK